MYRMPGLLLQATHWGLLALLVLCIDWDSSQGTQQAGRERALGGKPCVLEVSGGGRKTLRPVHSMEERLEQAVLGARFRSSTWGHLGATQERKRID